MLRLFYCWRVHYGAEKYLSFPAKYKTMISIPAVLKLHFIFYWRYNPLWVCILQPSSGAIASSRTRFLDHTRHIR